MNKIFWLVCFYLTIAFHFFLIFANIAAMIALPFEVSWFICIPLESFLFNLFFNRAFINCPITFIENIERKHLNKKPIKGFVGHHIINPIRKVYRRWKKN